MTAEVAVVLPVVVLAVAVLLGAGALGRAQVSCTDAARATARSLARGDDPARAFAAGRVMAGQDAAITVGSGDGSLLRVEVAMGVALPVVGGRSGSTLPVRCSSTARSEVVP